MGDNGDRLLSIDNVYAAYGHIEALRGVDVEVHCDLRGCLILVGLMHFQAVTRHE